jgi:Zn-finger nucleic acid-binding protein
MKCPRCNYGDTSGIILHKCPECGGIWTDKDQLMKVDEVVDGWKTDLDEDVAKYGPLLKKIEVEEQKQLDQAVSISKFGFVNSVLCRFCE